MNNKFESLLLIKVHSFSDKLKTQKASQSAPVFFRENPRQREYKVCKYRAQSSLVRPNTWVASSSTQASNPGTRLCTTGTQEIAREIHRETKPKYHRKCCHRATQSNLSSISIVRLQNLIKSSDNNRNVFVSIYSVPPELEPLILFLKMIPWSVNRQLLRKKNPETLHTAYW